MISIQRHNLEQIKIEHAKGVYKAMHARIKRASKKKLSSQSRNILNFILRDDILVGLLIGKPAYLKGINTHLISLGVRFNGKETKKKWLPLYNVLASVFNYNAFCRRNANWNAYVLADTLQVNVCPYCNEQYTFTIKTDEKQIRPQFDHFYSKDKYPYLALAFYNLIPSCASCNLLKNNMDMMQAPIMHPYENGNQELFEFRTRLKTMKEFKADEIEKKFGIAFFYGELDSFELDLQVKQGSRSVEAEHHRDALILKQRYNQHKDYAYQIIQRRIVYSDAYIDQLFSQYEGTIFKTREDVIKLVSNNYVQETDLDKRVLAKLSLDLMKENRLV